MKRLGPICVAVLLSTSRAIVAGPSPATLPGAGAGQRSVVPSAPSRVALLDSASTKEYFRRHYPNCSPPTSFYLGADEYQRYFRGWEFVLWQAQIPFDIVTDDDVTSGVLAKYKVLILSNTASLADEESQTIVKWVRAGGRLLATFGSGYKSIAGDAHQADLLKVQEGGTDRLHQLWHDPLSHLFSTDWLSPGVDVSVTRYAGPTACLANSLTDDVLHYGASGNMLIQRPAASANVLASLAIPDPTWKRNQPAIIVTNATRGLVVYFAFAPEYLVSKEFGLPAPETCLDGQNWAGRSSELVLLMECAVRYLLAN